MKTLLLIGWTILPALIPPALDAAATNSPAAPATATNLVWRSAATNAQGQTILELAVDTSQAPDLQAWGRHAGQLCAKWYPKICSQLASPGFTAPDRLQLRFRNGRGVAATSGNVITINANYVRHNTNDWGMVIHELTHVVQSYPHYQNHPNPWWLVEGIADYIRLCRFEPQAPRPRFNPDRDHYDSGYKVTALFLDWIQTTYDRHLVRQLNAACRDGTFQMQLFRDDTGKSIDELWKQYSGWRLQQAGAP